MALLVLSASAAGSVDGLAGSVGVATDYVYRGISLTQGEPSAFARVDYTAANGVYGGLWLGRIDTATPYGDLGAAEIDAYVGYGRRITSDIDINLQAARYVYPDSTFEYSFDYDELAVAFSWRELVSLTYALSDNFFGQDGPSHYGEIALRHPLPARLTLVAAAGFSSVRRPTGPDSAKRRRYGHAEVGLSRPAGPVRLDLWYTTAFNAKRMFYGDQTGSRLVGMVSFAF